MDELRVDIGTNGYIYQWLLGPMLNFVYLIVDASSRQCALVDPGWCAADIQSSILQKDLKLCSVLLTHHHFDHTDALQEILLSNPGIRVYASDRETSDYNLDYVTDRLQDNASLSVGSILIKCLLTSGHTSGSMSYLINDHFLCSGDTLFLGSCGRCDLEGGSAYDMQVSLSRLASLDDSIQILAGHSYDEKLRIDTIANQKKTNFYLLNHKI